MTHGNESATFLHAQFDDVEALVAAQIGWDLDFRQLDNGPVDARVEQVISGGLVLSDVAFGRRLHQRGQPPQGLLTFGLPDPSKLVDWRRRAPPCDAVLNFNARDGFDSVSAAGFTALVISVDHELYRQMEEALGAAVHPPRELSSASAFRCGPDQLQALTSAARNLLRLVETGSEAAPGAVQALRADLVMGLVRALSVTTAVGGVDNLKKRQEAVSRAVEFIDATAAEAPRVEDVYRAAGVSWRTLDRAFQERFGMPPKRYIASARLSGARRELRHSPPEASIADVANRWGFWHLGRFAADYREMFGELPSETRRG